MQRLIDAGLLQTEEQIFDDLVDQAHQKADLSLEPLAGILDSLTKAQLDEISKLATKTIRKVPLENLLEVQEISCNPFFKL